MHMEATFIIIQLYHMLSIKLFTFHPDVTRQMAVEWVDLLSPALFADMVWDNVGISRKAGSRCSRRVWNIHQVCHQSQQGRKAVKNL